MTTVRDVATALAALAPPHLAESWDNVGLLVGDPAAALEAALVTLDATPAVLTEAAGAGASAVVAFHPPLFKPLARVRADDAGSQVVWQAIRQGVSLLATHTALDNAQPGTSDFLAAELGVAVDAVLRPRRETGELKLVAFAPPEAADAVAAALAEAGAGRIGNYAECSFRSRGTGTFRPLPGAEPHVGEVGYLERADEVRLEMVLPRHALDGCIAALRAVHPYEEPAFDALPLVTEPNNTGLGRVGDLPAEVSLSAFAALVEQRTGAQHLRVVGSLDRPVRRVALVGGSGASLIADAARAGADVYVTADLKHHDALLAQRLGLALVDPGHGATEQFTVGQTAAWLRRQLPELRVVESTVPVEPFTARGDR